MVTAKQPNVLKTNDISGMVRTLFMYHYDRGEVSYSSLAKALGLSYSNAHQKINKGFELQPPMCVDILDVLGYEVIIAPKEQSILKT